MSAGFLDKREKWTFWSIVFEKEGCYNDGDIN